MAAIAVSVCLPYIVRELVRGETLSERIARGPMSESELVPLADRVAERRVVSRRLDLVREDVGQVLVHAAVDVRQRVEGELEGDVVRPIYQHSPEVEREPLQRFDVGLREPHLLYDRFETRALLGVDPRCSEASYDRR